MKRSKLDVIIRIKLDVIIPDPHTSSGFAFKSVDAWTDPAHPLWAVHSTLYDGEYATSGNTLVHIPTKLAVGQNYRSRAKAFEAVKQLESLPLDWATLTPETDEHPQDTAVRAGKWAGEHLPAIRAIMAGNN